jgi:hypothetical protein
VFVRSIEKGRVYTGSRGGECGFTNDTGVVAGCSLYLNGSGCLVAFIIFCMNA